MDTHHTPAMLDEVLKVLRVKSDGCYIDCTVAEGGHSEAILSAIEPGPRLLGIDVDGDALEVARERLKAYDDAAVLANGSYADLKQLAGQYGFSQADGIMFDLGLSSLQLERAERGFSFARPARLDMRFDRTQRLTAHQIVNRRSERELADIVFRYGEEPQARRIAAAIVQSRPLETTTQLAHVVVKAKSQRRKARMHPATRTFQALRIAVNRELDNLESGIEQAIEVLTAAGRLAIISYHSLEDRLVKNILRRESTGCICPPRTPACVCGHKATLRLVTRKVIKPSPREVGANPRSRSARLRVAERVLEPG